MLLGIERLSRILETKWGRADFADELFNYSMQTTIELVTTERLIAAEEARREELEAAKEAKYLEIRDAEMDFRMGKLSEADFRALDRQLRAEAVEILRDLDRLT